MIMLLAKYHILPKTFLTILMAFMLSIAFAEDTEKDVKSDYSPGEIVLPSETDGDEGKKCLTVCEKWGEDCIINPRTGSRKCRRVCKAFGQECF
jgi:hypothetical protein